MADLRCACGWTGSSWIEAGEHWEALGEAKAGHEVSDVASLADESVQTALDRHRARMAARGQEEPQDA